MKNRYFIVATLVVLFYLVVRSLYNHFDGVREERLWYVSQLHYNFSARLDSVAVNKGGSGLLYFHSYKKALDDSNERKLEKQLKYNGRLDYVLFLPNRRTALSVIHGADTILQGDSLTVNTDADSGVVVFRNRKIVVKNKTIDSNNGRPF